MELYRTWALLKDLRSHVKESPERLRPIQDRLFREAVNHAYDQVPFYRRYWDECGFNPRPVRGIEDLDNVPIVTTRMARRAAEDGALLARNLPVTGRSILYTTGSSGSPLAIIRGAQEVRLWRAQGLRIWFEHGFRWLHNKAQFDGYGGPPHFLQRLGLSRTQWISHDLPIEELQDRFLRAKAEWLIMTPTTLRRLARSLEESGKPIPQPRAIFCQGEIVDRHTRELSERIFGLPPINVYASTETGYMAWQCEQDQGLHVNVDTHLIQVLWNGKAVRAGEVGRVVVTDLRNRAMPFLRYENGDLAVAGDGSCLCGRGFPCLRSIEGRLRDAVYLKDGRIITPRAVVDHMSHVASPDAFRLYQDDVDRFRIELWEDVDGGGAARTCRLNHPADLATLESYLRILVGDAEISSRAMRASEQKKKTYCIAAHPSVLTVRSGSD